MPRERFADGQADGFSLSGPDWSETWEEEFAETDFCPVCGRRLEMCDCRADELLEDVDEELDGYIWGAGARPDDWEDE